MEGVAAGAHNQTRPLNHMPRKLAKTWNASTPLNTSGANTRKPLDLNVLLIQEIT
jgi:hypothetical protein